MSAAASDARTAIRAQMSSLVRKIEQHRAAEPENFDAREELYMQHHDLALRLRDTA